MAIVGRLAVLLTANTASFTRGLDKADRKTKKLKGSIGLLGVGLLRLRNLVGFGALGAGAAVVAFGVKTAGAIDEIAKVSQKLGIPIDGLIGLQRAARLSGVELRQLELGLQRMTRRVSEAAQGTGEAKAAIAELGLSARALNQLSPDLQFLRIATAISKTTTQADKIRLAFKLFDSEGVNLIRILDLGSKGLEQIKQDAKDAGLVFSNEAADGVERMNDAFGNLFDTIKGGARSALTGVAGVLAKGVDTTNDWLVSARRLGFQLRFLLGDRGVFDAAFGPTAQIDFSRLPQPTADLDGTDLSTGEGRQIRAGFTAFRGATGGGGGKPVPVVVAQFPEAVGVLHEIAGSLSGRSGSVGRIGGF